MSYRIKWLGTVSVTAVMVLSISLGAGSTAEAAMYVYQLPDGSRVISDHALQGKHYRLVRSSQNVNGLGVLVSARTTQFFRVDPSHYDALIIRTARRYEVDPALVKAVVHVESAFNPYATSHKGASGLMQLMPEVAEDYGVSNVYDPVQNVRGGVRYLKDLLSKYKNKYRLAVAAYNAGPQAVEKYRGVPPYVETRRYVKKVLHFKKRYSRLGRTDA